MGLFAVAHLAARHGAEVRLLPAAAGTAAQVWLPPDITVGGTAAPAAGAPLADRALASSGGYLRAAGLRRSGGQHALSPQAPSQRALNRTDATYPDWRVSTGPQPPVAPPGAPPLAVAPVGPAERPAAPVLPRHSGPDPASLVPAGITEAGLPARVSRNRRGGRHAASQQPKDDPRARRAPE
jgi:hypothetical protein